MSLPDVEDIPSTYRLDQHLHGWVCEGQLDWRSLGRLMRYRPGFSRTDLLRYAAQLAEAGLIEFDTTTEEVRLPQRVTIQVLIDLRLPQRWGKSNYWDAHDHLHELRDALLDYCREGNELDGIEANQLMLLTSMTLVGLRQGRDVALDAVYTAQASITSHQGSIPAAQLCAAALRLGDYTGRPLDLFPTAAAILA